MKNIFNLLIITGIIMIIGTAGASDAEGISLAQIAAQSVFAFKLIFSGIALKKVFEIAKKLIIRRIIREYACQQG